MLLEAAAAHDIHLAACYMVGDKAADIECGRRAGAKTILVMTGYGREQDCAPDYRVENAAAAVDLILTTAEV
jgi:D-glycero-D-manno-heptose 1,7-bisphosphate phosphatase